MERRTYFVNVILPLALPRLLTYRVPVHLNEEVAVGKRVVAQLGKSRLYTAIVREVHETPPSGYEAKYIDEVLDAQPILHEEQLKLWEWVASYYCCTMGEVMNAALPAGLKLASETTYTLTDPDVLHEAAPGSPEAILVHTLRERGTMNGQEIAALLPGRGLQRLLKTLVEQRVITPEEEIREKYKPRTADFIRIGAAADTEEKLHQAFEQLERTRAHKQADVLLSFLRLSGWDQGKFSEVSRTTLQQQSGATAAMIRGMEEKGLLSIQVREVGRLPAYLLASERPRVLSTAQLAALREVERHWTEKPVCLLHGVTSSGKTEIYASLIQQAIDHKQQVLFLLPEIALTTQIITRLRKYFGKRIGVYHSGYSDNERTEVWNKVLGDEPGECDIILGARSALFLPFRRLGLVIVDEEHEHSFKQHDPAPRYHARDTAIVLAQQFNARVLLGSATPAIETYWNARHDRFGLVELNERFGGVALPEIILCDLRAELKAKTMSGNFSSVLRNEIAGALQRDEQVILFQNRRGYAPIWQCHSCSWIPMCTRCDVSMTYHKQAHQLKCHYCGYTADPPPACHACGSTDLRMLGFGTEKLEEELGQMFPDAPVQRMDLDTTRSKSSYQRIISDFEAGHIRILVGTQMVTKGLDFDRVSVVGILNADRMMNYPDFRSMERSYQLMMQVAGRAGRKDKQGRVVIQTYSPDHWLFGKILKGDYKGLYDHESIERQHFHYPPFVRLVRLTLRHKEDDVAAEAAAEAGKALREIFAHRVLGPEKPYVPRINTYYLHQLQLKLDRSNHLASDKDRMMYALGEILRRDRFKSVRLTVDIDPL